MHLSRAAMIWAYLLLVLVMAVQLLDLRSYKAVDGQRVVSPMFVLEAPNPGSCTGSGLCRLIDVSNVRAHGQLRVQQVVVTDALSEIGQNAGSRKTQETHDRLAADKAGHPAASLYAATKQDSAKPRSIAALRSSLAIGRITWFWVGGLLLLIFIGLITHIRSTYLSSYDFGAKVLYLKVR